MPISSRLQELLSEWIFPFHVIPQRRCSSFVDSRDKKHIVKVFERILDVKLIHSHNYQFCPRVHQASVFSNCIINFWYVQAVIGNTNNNETVELLFANCCLCKDINRVVPAHILNSNIKTGTSRICLPVH